MICVNEYQLSITINERKCNNNCYYNQRYLPTYISNLITAKILTTRKKCKYQILWMKPLNVIGILVDYIRSTEHMEYYSNVIVMLNLLA